MVRAVWPDATEKTPRRTAEKKALGMRPASNSRWRSSRPPRRASAAPAREEATAPANEAAGDTRGESPARAARAAPVAAPPDVPSRKGSDSGVFKMACSAAAAKDTHPAILDANS